jgi:hypothetical protein
VARTRHHDTHPRRSQGTVRARQRIAAQRAAQQRARARRRWLMRITAAGAVLAIVVGFVAGQADLRHRGGRQRISRPAKRSQPGHHGSGGCPGAHARREDGHPAAAGQGLRPGTEHRRQAGHRVCQRRVLPVLCRRTLAAGRGAVSLRHLEPSRRHPVLGHRRLPEHCHALVPHRQLPQLPPHTAHHRAHRQPRPPPATPHPAGHHADPRLRRAPPTSTAPTSPGPSRSSTSATATSWPGRNTTRRSWPACPRRRSPASSAIQPARWSKRSTGQPT